MGLQIRLISGKDHSSRQRFLADLLQKMKSREWIIDEVPAGGLRSAVSFWQWSEESVACWMDDPSDEDIDTALSLIKGPIKKRIVVFNVKGKLRTSRLKNLSRELGAKGWKEFNEEPPWKAEKSLSSFCVEEASRNGKEMDKRLAKVFPVLCGCNTGFLRFEIEKLCLYADSEGSSEIDSEVFKKGFSGRPEASVYRLCEKLTELSVKDWLIESDRVFFSQHGDSTIYLCRYLSAYLLKRIRALSLYYSGFSSKDSARELGAHPWQYENVLVPSAKAFGQRKMVELVQRLAGVEQAVFKGESHPWIKLQVAVSHILMT